MAGDTVGLDGAEPVHLEVRVCKSCDEGTTSDAEDTDA